MDADAADILRGSSDSPLHRALELLAAGTVQGVVSAGNTTALMALGRRQIDMLHGIGRPAFCSAMPTVNGVSWMLDLGANVDCSADNLQEFALMGSALVTALSGTAEPGVALLSNGKEATKGNAVIKEAAQRLAADQRINYLGYVEGDDLHAGLADVIVCDGLLGNVALKAAEGTAQYTGQLIARTFSRHWWLKLLASVARPQLKALRHAVDADRHGGAFLLGLQGVVVKSHGASNSESFAAALGQAVRCIEHDMVSRLGRNLATEQN
jgi:glycerol-3-phosphate acyltransferase PlsX